MTAILDRLYSLSDEEEFVPDTLHPPHLEPSPELTVPGPSHSNPADMVGGIGEVPESIDLDRNVPPGIQDSKDSVTDENPGLVHVSPTPPSRSSLRPIRYNDYQL